MSDQFERLKATLADGYAVERELGAGRMATIYLATDVKHERQVAINVLRPVLGASAVLGGVSSGGGELGVFANGNLSARLFSGRGDRERPCIPGVGRA